MERDVLLAYLRLPAYQPAKMKELAGRLGVPQADYRAFRRLVQQLEAEGQVVRLRHNRFGPPQAHAEMVGQLQVHPRGFGFVTGPGVPVDVHIPREGRGLGLDGDLVRVEVTGRDAEGGSPQGRVLKVLREAERAYLGTLGWRGKRAVVTIDDARFEHGIQLLAPPPAGTPAGARVLVELTARGWKAEDWRGRLVRVLGPADDPAFDLLSVTTRYGLAADYPEAASAQARTLAAGWSGAQMQRQLERREDLRELCCVTIDPPEARDFDDAVSLERVDGGYRLGVHIADVSHFVPPDTELDRAAFARGTSVYLIDHVVHMLPPELAAGVCSLKPGEDRLALSVLVEVDEEGQRRGFRLVESVVRSAARLDYEQVQQALDGSSGRGAAAEYRPLLVAMQQLADKLHSRRLQRGALDLDVPEPLAQVDAKGRTVRLGQRVRLASYRLIEEFMLVANESVGQYASQRRLPVLFRVHPPPGGPKLGRLAAAVPGLSAVADAPVAPAALQRWLRSIAGRPDAPVLRRLLLQTLARAAYAAEDQGHFGLACRRYLHFTAPIRRYPDLLVHRLVKAAVRQELTAESADRLRQTLEWTARWTSRCEQRADEAERAYLRRKQLRYLAEHAGEEYAGTVAGVVRGGVFVELAGVAAEGFCAGRGLGEPYQFDTTRLRLVGRRSGRTIGLGDPVRVRVVSADLVAQELELALLAELAAPGRPRRKGKQVGATRAPGGREGRAVARGGRSAGRRAGCRRRPPRAR